MESEPRLLLCLDIHITYSVAPAPALIVVPSNYRGTTIYTLVMIIYRAFDCFALFTDINECQNKKTADCIA